MSFYQRVIASSIIAVAAISASAAEPSAEHTPEKIQQLVKQLGDENYDNRKNAEKELAKAGAKAKDALTAAANSNDAQVKATAKRLLGRLRFATLGTVNYLDILPQQSLILAKASNIGDTLKKGEATFLGKFILAKHFEPLRAKFQEEMANDPEGQKLFELWTSRFKGQVAGAVWELNIMMGPQGIKAGAIAEITDGDPAAVYNEILELGNAQFEKSLYNDVEIAEGPGGEGALALAGNHLIIGANGDSVKGIIDNLINAAPQGFSKSPTYQKAKPALGERSDAMLALDLGGFIANFAMMMPPGFDDMMQSSGAKDMKLLAYNSAITGDSFEDRLVMVMEGKPSGFRAASQIPADAPAPLEAFAAVPANAVAAQTGYMDGSKMGPALKDYFAALKKMSENQPGGGRNAPDIAKVIAEFETKTGVKLDDVWANLKGNIAYWAVLGPPPSTTAPDLGAMLTCVDADKAKATATMLALALNKGTGKEAVKEVAYKTRTLYTVDLAAINPNMPKEFPYASPCFVVDGNRIFLASSSQSLQKQLNNIDAKAPGLLTHPEFVKAMGGLKPEERKGQIAYADLKSLLTLGGNVGLPLLAAQAPDEEFKKFLGTLPKPEELFKDMPPLILSSNDRGERTEMIIRAPFPPIPTLYAAVVGIAVMAQNRAMHAVE
ncbi:MAG TPA: hypothetical protein VEJ63_02900 [Planctomycetota bacterium]|nr:hypothetical protein [Planctomycetota bacterium]